jgi:hypothetical protein
MENIASFQGISPFFAPSSPTALNSLFLSRRKKLLADEEKLREDRIQMDKIDDFKGVNLPVSSLEIILDGLWVLLLGF